MLKLGLICVRVEWLSEPTNKTDKVANNMGCEKDKTRNISDRKYMSQGSKNKSEM